MRMVNDAAVVALLTLTRSKHLSAVTAPAAKRAKGASECVHSHGEKQVLAQAFVALFCWWMFLLVPWVPKALCAASRCGLSGHCPKPAPQASTRRELCLRQVTEQLNAQGDWETTAAQTAKQQRQQQQANSSQTQMKDQAQLPTSTVLQPQLANNHCQQQ